MLKIRGYIAKEGLEGGAFLTHVEDADGLVRWIQRACSEGGTLVLTNLEKIQRQREPVPFKDAFTWHAYARDLCPSGSPHSDNMAHPSREDATRIMWEWMCEQWPDLTGTADELAERLLDLETGDRVNLTAEFGGGGWISLLRLRVHA